MSDLADRGINEILVEAGPTLVGNLLNQNFVDEMIVYIAPHLLGESSHGFAKLPAITTMQDRIELKIIESKTIGKEIKIKIKPLLN